MFLNVKVHSALEAEEASPGFAKVEHSFLRCQQALHVKKKKSSSPRVKQNKKYPFLVGLLNMLMSIGNHHQVPHIECDQSTLLP